MDCRLFPERWNGDAGIVQAMHQIPVPLGLREQILRRLDPPVSVGVVPPTVASRARWPWIVGGLAAAILTGLALRFWSLDSNATGPVEIAASTLLEEIAGLRPSRSVWNWPDSLAKSGENVAKQSRSRFRVAARPPSRPDLKRLQGLSTAKISGRISVALHYDLRWSRDATAAEVTVYVLPTAVFRISGLDRNLGAQFETEGVSVALWFESGTSYAGVYHGPASHWRQFLRGSTGSQLALNTARW